jgi:hypothetical protein
MTTQTAAIELPDNVKNWTPEAQAKWVIEQRTAEAQKAPVGDVLIASAYGSPRLRVNGANCYERLPERDSWLETETYRRPDGTTYVRTREAGRWGAVFSVGGWDVTR